MKYMMLTLCIISHTIYSSEQCDANASVQARKNLVAQELQTTHYTHSEYQDLNIREAVLNGSLERVQYLLTTYKRDTVPHIITDDAQAKLNEVSGWGTLKEPIGMIVIGSAATIGIAAMLWEGRKRRIEPTFGLTIPSGPALILLGLHQYAQRRRDIDEAKQITDLIHNYKPQQNQLSTEID